MKQISNYQVEDTPIGSGGMGQVLKGYAPDGTPVAIKEILPQFVMDMEYRSRIDREIGFLQKLNNDNIVKIYDHFQLGNKLYIVMEMVEGRNIEQFVGQHGAVPVEQAVRYMMKILQTMQYVHEQNIIHRDIKPSNIMIRPNNEICLLDFGIAKDTTSTVGGTLVGTVIGTDGYMSPEQADGMSIDHRSDIYSLGCVFFFMLTGHHAYNKLGSDVETMLNIVNKPFPRISEYVEGVPQSIQNVMDHATDKNMLKRYQSCREFLSELMKVSGIGTRVSGNKQQGISVSVGRENCDICVGVNNYKVSRHHADIHLRHFTGGTYYVYTDCSSNGTLIDGNMYTKGMSCNIQNGTTPTIYLAADPTSQLNWEEVRTMIAARLKEANSESVQENVKDKASAISESDTNKAKSYSLDKAPIGLRFVASLMDGLICSLPLVPFYIFFLLAMRETELSTPYLCIAILFYLVSLTYSFIKDGFNGQSVGKRIVGLAVINLQDNSRCSFGRSALRCLISSLLCIIPLGCLIEPIMVLATNDGRRLADKAAGTQVVKL